MATISKVLSTFLLLMAYARTNEQGFISAPNKTAAINTNATANNASNVVNKTVTPSPVVLAEGGKISNQPIPEQHMGREHVIYKAANESLAPKNASTGAVKSTTKVIPVHEKLDDNTTTKPRKGVNIEDYKKTISSTLPPFITPSSVIANETIKNVTKSAVSLNKTSTTTTTTTTIKPSTKKVRKPTVTIGSDDESPGDSKSKPEVSKAGEKTNVPSIEYITENKRHSTDYVVPIVAVILSVPLVAILISVLYKRGAEWWQHRHYRRMDFLIEGMYNN